MLRATLVFLIANLVGSAPALGAEALRLKPGGAEILRTDGKMATVILGDPELADVTLVNETTLALTARKPGSTTLLVLEADGSEVARYDVQIGAPPPGVRVQSYRGTTGETRAYWCSLSSCIPPQDARPENVAAAVRLRGGDVDDAEAEKNASSDGTTPAQPFPAPGAVMDQK